MNYETQIAAFLKVEASGIKKIIELHHVWCVVVVGKRPVFVSKKKVLSPKLIESSLWCLEASCRRQEDKKWVARIDGICPKWGFVRSFLSAYKLEWGKYGMRKAEFEIQEPGYYQDSDGDYFRATIVDGKIDCEICSKLEVQSEMQSRKLAMA